jgi:SAM-dependent methyltransferase
MSSRFLIHRSTLMKRQVPAVCNACESADTRVVATLLSEVDGREYKAVTCNSCALVFADPVPDLSFGSLQDIYGAAYTEGQREPDEKPDSLRVLRDATNRQMDIVEQYVQSGLALNVGAMSGAAKVLEERGWRLRVVEASQYAAQTARDRWGLDVTVCKIEDFQCAPNTFDFIKLGHVIEHLVDPRLALERLCRILRPNGVILVDTDNAGGLRTQIELSVRKLLGERLSVGLVKKLTKKDLRKRFGRLIPPVHLYTFSERSLVRLLAASGFDVISVRKPAWGDPTWFPLPDFSRMSAIERAFIKLDQVGAIFGNGDLISVLARKRAG